MNVPIFELRQTRRRPGPEGGPSESGTPAACSSS